jgi:hypothetical protein
MWWPATVTGHGASSGRGRRQTRLRLATVPTQGRGHRHVDLRPVAALARGTSPSGGWHSTETGGGAEVGTGSKTVEVGRPHLVGQWRLELGPARGGRQWAVGRRWVRGRRHRVRRCCLELGPARGGLSGPRQH